MSPPAGTTTTDVMPSLRAGASNVDAGLMPSHTGNDAATAFSPRAPRSTVAGTDPISLTPSPVSVLMSPGVTHLPVASIRVAPLGTATPAPTATMRPSRTTTVPFSITGPLTGYTLPPVIA